MAVNGGPNITTDGLVFSLDISNHKSYSTGSGQINDIVYDNTCTFVGDYQYTFGDRFIRMGADNSWLTVENSDVFDTNVFTIDLFFVPNVDLDNSRYRVFISNFSSAFGYQLVWHPSKFFYMYVNNGIVLQSSVYSTGISANTPVHLVAQYDENNDNNTNMYVNDVKYTYSSHRVYFSPIANTVLMGKSAGSAANYSLDCNFYYFRFYNRILPDTEIKQNYNVTRRRFNL